jgi:hypothetical protein
MDRDSRVNREALMSTVDPSSIRLPDAGAITRLSDAGRRLHSVFRAAAFWASIPLPLLIFGTLVTGVVASTPLLVAALALLNVCCAVIGHSYSPEI